MMWMMWCVCVSVVCMNLPLSIYSYITANKKVKLHNPSKLFALAKKIVNRLIDIAIADSHQRFVCVGSCECSMFNAYVRVCVWVCVYLAWNLISSSYHFRFYMHTNIQHLAYIESLSLLLLLSMKFIRTNIGEPSQICIQRSLVLCILMRTKLLHTKTSGVSRQTSFIHRWKIMRFFCHWKHIYKGSQDTRIIISSFCCSV